MWYLAIDIGTTTIKGIIYNELGHVKRSYSTQSKTQSTHIGFMEQDPEVISENVLSIIARADHDAKQAQTQIESLVFSAYMHSLIAVDEKHHALTACILWSDSRSMAQVERYKENDIGFEIYKNTGTPLHPMSPLYKILWLKEKRPDIFEKTYKFISIKAYLMKKITGKYIEDYSIASASGLFNIHTLNWDKQALAETGLSAERFATPLSPTTVLHSFSPEFLNRFSESPDFSIVIGASDGCLANLGSHGLKKNTGVITIGTSGAVRVVTDTPVIDPEARLFTYILAEDFFVCGGAINNGGLIFDWFKKIFTKVSEIDAFLKDYNGNTTGLLFLPFLNGERAPYWNSALRGSFLGIQNNHTHRDFLFSALQGTCFAIKDVFESLKEINPNIETIYANGGFTQSHFWINLLSSILEKDIHILQQGDGACFGAFLLAQKALGNISSWDECENFFAEPIRYKTHANEHYQKMFGLYKESIVQNKTILEKLTAMQSETLDT